MRAFILLLGFMCMALSLSCGKTGDLYLPDELSGENGSVGTAQDDGPSSETGSTTGR